MLVITLPSSFCLKHAERAYLCTLKWFCSIDGCSVHTGGHVSCDEMEDEQVQPAGIRQGGSHFVVILGYFYECVVVC